MTMADICEALDQVSFRRNAAEHAFLMDKDVRQHLASLLREIVRRGVVHDRRSRLHADRHADAGNDRSGIVFGAVFKAARTWKTVAKVIDGLPLDQRELQPYRACTGRSTLPNARSAGDCVALFVWSDDEAVETDFSARCDPARGVIHRLEKTHQSR
jgi:hypothetical protein